jgi:putative DNA primase/helicase
VPPTSRGDIRELLDTIADRGCMREAEKRRQIVGAMFRWALAQDIVAVNPTGGLEPYDPGVPRDRVLTVEEIELVWKWLESDALSLEAADILKLELLIGARCGEISDTCLPLDELGQVEGRELGQALYMATGGVGKQRMRRDATLKPSHSWRVMVLSSGEFPIETKLNEDPKHGARAHAGQLVRAVDIPVCGIHGVFDDFESDDVEPSAFAEKCKNATSTFYGMAGPEFIRRLIAQNISAKDVREHVDAFVQSALKDIKERHGQAARVAQRFGLVCAAGEFGVQFGILPWEQGDTLNDATELLKIWLDERGGSTPYETRQAIAQIRHFIEAHGDSRFDDITTPDPDRKPVANRAGFRRDHGEARRWLIPPEVWRNEVCAGLNAREVAKTLAGLRILEPDSEGKFSRSETIGGRKQRFYVLKPAIFEGWDEAAETSSEHLEHQAHIKTRVSQNRGSQE